MEAFNRRQPYEFSSPAHSLFEEVYESLNRECGTSLVDHIAALSTLFTKERREITGRYFDQSSFRAAYAAYFLPVNFAKIQMLLSELPEEWSRKPALSVLDLGAGLGTASLALMDWLARRKRLDKTALHILALDHSGAALTEAARLWHLYRRRCGHGQAELETSIQSFESLAAGNRDRNTFSQTSFDLILLANSLNESFLGGREPNHKRAALLKTLLSNLKTDGTLVVLEPALRSTARDLHAVRDLVLAQGGCNVYSPCLHERQCPALIRADDWCHEERPWIAPAWIQTLDEGLKFIKDALKFSYLMLRQDGRSISPRGTDIYRVVSELRILKGERRAWLCNELGRSEVGRLDRKSTDANAAFDQWQRGDLVQVDRVTRKERGGRASEFGRIEDDSTVTIVKPVC